ncbi:two-component sensor histidine kinase [Paenibacillus radicis (ex Gao et al. 2016)]|uniref:histidine kinase n=1 Tax=Paenibacillus radicis (ex Gao et al. 2016) TaxID=1737354 RepID=A0A917M6B0_9BACL|nr:two-component sensor histidine kinase [Paenibacillus radicis (ex Gao et al. 2016)]
MPLSIRRKLYLSYMLMTIVPFIVVSGIIIVTLSLSGVEDLRDIKKNTEILYVQSFTAGELHNALQNNPDRVDQPSELAKWDAKLAELNSGFVFFREGKVDQISTYLKKFVPNEDWQKYANSTPEEVAYKQYRFRFVSLSFTYSNGDAGKALLLLRADQVPMYWHPIFGLSALCIIGLTGVLLTYFVSRSIIRPIQKLKTAALLMKEGDLSQRVNTTSKGEVGDLGNAFEEMRVRLKHSIDQSLQYEDNRKMLLSHISHDLKTPISAIKGYVEGIMDGIANTDEKRERYMRTIYRKATDMDRLIDELFLFSKLDMQKVAFDFKVIDLRSYLLYFMEEQQFDMEKSEIDFRISDLISGGSSLYVAADSEKLSRALGNILSNSVKYMGELHGDGEDGGKSITVRIATRSDREAIIVIEDSGPGIEPEDLPYIFDGFYRAEQSRNSETGGSGLGLAIVKQIIEGHGGRVWAENAQEGGSRFYVALPIATQAKTVTQDEENIDY